MEDLLIGTFKTKRRTAMSKWEVQTYTLCDGWKNLWTVDGLTETFKSHEDAKNSIGEHLKDCLEDGIEEDKYNYRIIKKGESNE